MTKQNYRRNVLDTAAAQLQRHDLRALWVFLLGGPGETPETVEQTLAFIASSVPSPNAVYVTLGVRVYPGSPMGDDLNRGRLEVDSLRYHADHRDVPFYYSNRTPPAWLEARLSRFQREHPQVMLSSEGHDWLTQAALSVMNYLPVRKPYWQYVPTLNAVRRQLRWPMKRSHQPLEIIPALTPAPHS